MDFVQKKWTEEAKKWTKRGESGKMWSKRTIVVKSGQNGKRWPKVQSNTMFPSSFLIPPFPSAAKELGARVLLATFGYFLAFWATFGGFWPIFFFKK